MAEKSISYPLQRAALHSKNPQAIKGTNIVTNIASTGVAVLSNINEYSGSDLIKAGSVDLAKDTLIAAPAVIIGTFHYAETKNPISSFEVTEKVLIDTKLFELSTENEIDRWFKHIKDSVAKPNLGKRK